MKFSVQNIKIRSMDMPYNPIYRAARSLCRDDIALLQAVAVEIGTEKALAYFGFDYAGRKLTSRKTKKMEFAARRQADG